MSQSYRFSTVVVDIESTGSDAAQFSLASLGGVVLGNPDVTFYEECQMEPHSRVDPEALAVNGFNYKTLTDRSKPSAISTLDMFNTFSFQNDCWILASWSPFDFNFLKHKFFRFRLPWNFGWNHMDVRPVVVAKFMETQTPLPEHSIHMSDALSFCGLPLQNKVHNGLWDAKATTEILLRCMFGKPILQDFMSYPVPEKLQK